MADVDLGGDSQAVLVQERELRFGCSKILALREEHKREPLTDKGLHCMRTRAIKQHHRRLTINRATGERTKLLELQCAIVFRPVRKRTTAERPEGFCHRRPSVTGVAVQPGRVPAVHIDRREWEIPSGAGAVASEPVGEQSKHVRVLARVLGETHATITGCNDAQTVGLHEVCPRWQDILPGSVFAKSPLS